MLKSENLAGLTDKQQARTNLEVYSKAEVDEQVNSSKHIEVNVETAWNVQHKVGTTAQGNYVPKKGDILLINFVHGTVIARPTLNIDGS